MWTPPERLRQLVELQMTTLREPLQQCFYREDRPRIDAEMAARGLYLSGPRLTALSVAAARVIGEFADGFAADVPARVEAVLGSVPLEAWDWILHEFDQNVGGLAVQLGQYLDSEAQRMNAGLGGQFSTELGGSVRQRRRPLEVRAGTARARAELRSVASGERMAQEGTEGSIDVFISHAHEDREDVARPLAEGLIRRGFSVWIDKAELKVGDSVFGAIDAGLARSRFGVVVLSPSFFARNWPRRELGALAALADAEGRYKILPVWHQLQREDVARQSPLLADVFAAKTEDGLESVLAQIADALNAR